MKILCTRQIFCDTIAVVHDIIWADREGYWKLHLDVVQPALYLFALLDCINYLWVGSFSLEEMWRLPETAPSVNKYFVKWIFSSKRSLGDSLQLEDLKNLNKVSTFHPSEVMELLGVQSLNSMSLNGILSTM